LATLQPKHKKYPECLQVDENEFIR